MEIVMYSAQVVRLSAALIVRIIAHEIERRRNLANSHGNYDSAN